MIKSRSVLLLVIGAFLLIVFSSSASALDVPQEGLRAEIEGNWHQALTIYHEVLDADPNRADLWLRIADIEARLGHKLEAAQALATAAHLNREDAPLHYRLSQAWAEANRPDLAMQAIETALYLDPRNQDYQKARSILANWQGDSNKAASSLEMLAKLHPADQSIELEQARAFALRNDLDKSARAYKKYLRTAEPDRQVLLENEKVEAWRGNYAKSQELLEEYRKKFGKERQYLEDRARLMAWADRPNRALELVDELQQNNPGDFQLRFTRAISLRAGNRPAEALALAEELRRERPSRDTDDLYLMAWTPVRHHIDASVSYYSDNDSIGHLHSKLFGAYFTSPNTSLGARLDYDYLTADAGSGLENIDGSESEEVLRGALEVWHRFTPWLAANFSFGGSQTAELDTFSPRLDLMLRPADTLDLRLTGDYGYYLISPRSVSSDVRRSDYQAEATWRPDLRYTVVAVAGYDDFSDDNSKWLAILAPRRAFLRTQYYNLDLGIRAWLYGFDRDLTNGYYDPENYQSYMATAFNYWKINRDNGVSLIGNAGMLKDNTMDSFQFGWDAVLEGYFGIYRDWMLKAYFSIMGNQRQSSGAFNARSGGLTLTRRF